MDGRQHFPEVVTEGLLIVSVFRSERESESLVAFVRGWIVSRHIVHRLRGSELAISP